MRQLPPFSAIRAFESAARHLSFKDAAKELCVTPSAISHQIKTLEEYLSTDLFIRHHNGLTLTLTGEAYVGKLTLLLDSLEHSTKEVTEPQETTLRVLATPGFAARWLVPRMERMSFASDIRLRISQGAPDVDFSSNDADVVIHWADNPVSGCVVEPFMSSAQYPVASPEFVRSNTINTPEDLLKLTLFHEEVMDGWADWFDAANVDFTASQLGPCFPHCELGHTAAEQGQGVSLAYDALIKDTVEAGKLERLFNINTSASVIYSFCCQQCRYDEPKIKAFHDWIFNEIQAETDLLSKSKATHKPKLNVVGNI